MFGAKFDRKTMCETEVYNPSFLPDLLPIFYKKLFPYNAYYRWLNYGGVPKTYFTHREFSFTLKDDVYIRYQSFADQTELQNEIQKRCPYKIDIGAVFSHKPKDHNAVKSTLFQAQEKELVFDIDMTDYDDVRSCCSGADICLKCWPLMKIAIKIINRALREDFGYQHLLWVYSGRRGIHCWVCDPAARKLTQPERSAIAEYLSIVKGGENQVKKVTLSDQVTMHPFVSRSLSIVQKYFEKYSFKDQDFLGTDEQIQKVLSLIPDEDIRQNILTIFKNPKAKATSSRLRWTVISSVLEGNKCLHEIMLQYCFPRLDVNVSKGVNHLLKSPFSVHPKTGRVCVPIDADNVDAFNPFTVPLISEICDEVNKQPAETTTTTDENTEPKRKTRDYKCTRLNSAVQLFEKFVKELEVSRKGMLIEQSDKQMEF